MLTRSWKPVVCTDNPSLLHFPDYRISKHTGEIRRGIRRIIPHYREQDAARVCLYYKGAKKNVILHRAYLLVFHGIPPIDDKGRSFTGDHINGNHLDNAPINLRWLSIKDQNNQNNKIKSRKTVYYTQHFQRQKGEVVKRFPSRANLWQFTSHGRIMFNRKLRNGGKPRRDGYFAVKIDGKQLYLHRIIAHLFLGYDLEDTQHVVMHLDHNKTNCHMLNLRVGTHAQNMRAEAVRRKAKKRI